MLLLRVNCWTEEGEGKLADSDFDIGKHNKMPDIVTLFLTLIILLVIFGSNLV